MLSDTLKVSILGQEYTISKKTTLEDEELKDKLAYCNCYTKQIVLDKDLDDEVLAFQRKVLRHELVHALMWESGFGENSKYGDDEELVDWIAIQFPKLATLLKDAGCEN